MNIISFIITAFALIICYAKVQKTMSSSYCKSRSLELMHQTVLHNEVPGNKFNNIITPPINLNCKTFIRKKSKGVFEAYSLSNGKISMKMKLNGNINND